ncbi:MAG: LysM peptidoglycan-binding domain-containing protein [Anaerolineales bacterium]|nr:LysM peptidoglycan-binding domain-containing protein [Anaerolineales bacterium]
MTNRTKSGRWLVRIQTVCLLALVVVALVAQPTAAQSDVGSLGAEAQVIFAAINQTRQEYGLPPLNLNAQLNAAAQNHVNDVVANGNWGHYGSDGSNVQMRTARSGYGSIHVSENWVATSTPEQAMNWWMNDWIHRVNILQSQWDDVGVGAALAGNGYWVFVTDFGNSDGSAPAPITAAAQVTDHTATTEIYTSEVLPPEGLDYVIQGGDTLMGIAYRYGTDWQDIALANNMDEEDFLQIGDHLRLPGRGGIGGPVGVTETVMAGKQIHVVRTGETLWTIAARYKITWQEVAAVNNLGEYDLLQIGEELHLPASLDDEETAITEAASAANSDEEAALESEDASTSDEETAAADAEPNGFASDSKPATETNVDRSAENIRFIQRAAPPKLERYAVKAGDTLGAIAMKYDIPWQQLAEANDLTEDSFLQIGQELEIPADAAAPATTPTETEATPEAQPADQPTNAASSWRMAPPSTASGFTSDSKGSVYIVRPGDTILAIAIRHELDWRELLTYNGLDEDSLIQPGQEIRLP